MEAMERLVNLAMFLESSPGPVTAQQCRAEVAGYPEDQDEPAFLRMFERDKEELRAAGLVLRVTKKLGSEAYAIDRDASHVRPAGLAAEEEATLRVIAASLATDPSFPFREDLRLALAKTLPEVDTPCALPVAGAVADEDPDDQGAIAGTLSSAAEARKRVVFGYTNARGESGRREVEPYGLFLREGRWYLVGRDLRRDAVRTFAVARIGEVEVNTRQPKTADFERPEDFDISTYVLLPFQYGEGRSHDAVVRIEPEAAFRAESLTAGVGTLEPAEDGAARQDEARGDADSAALTWRVTYRDPDTLLRWLIANGPGLTPVSPPELVERLGEAMREVAARHGS